MVLILKITTLSSLSTITAPPPSKPMNHLTRVNTPFSKLKPLSYMIHNKPQGTSKPRFLHIREKKQSSFFLPTYKVSMEAPQDFAEERSKQPLPAILLLYSDVDSSAARSFAIHLNTICIHWQTDDLPYLLQQHFLCDVVLYASHHLFSHSQWKIPSHQVTFTYS